MTVTRPSSKETGTASLAGRAIEVRWSAVASRERREFVITLQPVDETHALLEAWIEAPSGLRNTVPRQPVGYALGSDGPYLHVDAFLDDRRVLAASLARPMAGGPTEGLLYAQSVLLGQAGFAPGAYDPPTARLVAREADAASA